MRALSSSSISLPSHRRRCWRMLTLKRSEPHALADPSHPNEISMDGTMQYCADLGVDPSEVIMLALAWFTKAPTMGRFSKREWVEAWQAIGSVFPPFPFFFPWIYCHWCKELRADSDGLCRRTGRIRWSDKRSRSTSSGNNSRRPRRSEKSTSLRSTMPRPKGKRACVSLSLLSVDA